jgi:FkbM family methyltransferase
MLVVKYAKFLPSPIKEHIIQIGAHFGHEAEAYEAAGFRSIEWIEADPDIFQALSLHISNLIISKHSVHNALITSSSRDLHKFYRYSNEGASNSMYLPTELFRQSFEGISVAEDAIELSSIALDDFIEINNIHPSILVIDVQGAEMEVLKGGNKALESAKIVEIEVSTQKVYSNGALFDQVDEYLKERGFALITHVPWHGDVLYLKVGSVSWICNLGLRYISLQYATEYYSEKFKNFTKLLFSEPRHAVQKLTSRLSRS